MKDSLEQPEKHVQFDESNEITQANDTFDDSSINSILNEFSNRFDMMAEEIGSLKDIVLKLQAYTMDVNKTLLEERIHILSDLDSTNQPVVNQMFEISNDPTTTSQANTSVVEDASVQST